jgi:hypothetical protein
LKKKGVILFSTRYPPLRNIYKDIPMLAFDNSKDLDLTLDVMRSVAGHKDYLM